jgi:hypothetical protein
MKREDLRAFSGFRVGVIYEETPAMAILHADDPERAHLTVPQSANWTEEHPHYLSDEEIAGMSEHGANHLRSNIVLSK